MFNIENYNLIREFIQDKNATVYNFQIDMFSLQTINFILDQAKINNLETREIKGVIYLYRPGNQFVRFPSGDVSGCLLMSFGVFWRQLTFMNDKNASPNVLKCLFASFFFVFVRLFVF